MQALRDYSERHFGEDLRNLSGAFENALFNKCTFEKLNGLTLKDCVLLESEFDVKKIADALGFTLTLDCHSFRNVKLSPLVVELLLMLILQSEGNTEIRTKIMDHVLGRKRVAELLREIKDLESK